MLRLSSAISSGGLQAQRQTLEPTSRPKDLARVIAGEPADVVLGHSGMLPIPDTLRPPPVEEIRAQRVDRLPIVACAIAVVSLGVSLAALFH